MHKVFIISDTHFPFHSKRAYKKMLALIKKEKPTHVVQIGDLLDQYVFSKYTRKMEITPDFDVSRGLEMAKQMWETIQKIVPRAKCYQLIGNHDVRLSKRISELLPELSGFFSHKSLYKFKGVWVAPSDRSFLTLFGVKYVHGWLSKSIDHARHFNAPTVHGHRHRPCIEVDRPGLWSMDVGFMANEKSAPLQYTMSKITKWTIACGIVENGQPRVLFL
jgi:predicted phosphodiesterase